MKKRLFTPGPTPVPEQVMLRMAEPLIHHRSAEFRAVMQRVNANLQYLFQTTAPVVTLSCSGTGAMEAAMVSLCSPGDTVIAVNGGKFGERWVAMGSVYGLETVEIKTAWGEAPTEGDLLAALRAYPRAHAVFLTHSETSTGTAADLHTIAHLIREHSDALVCVDGISSVGALELRFDTWGIDVCVTGSQKGLMIPPGLAFVALSSRAVEAIDRAKLPRFYFDLRRALKSWETADTPWTPAVSLVMGVDAALGMIHEEGLEAIWRRHARLARGLRAGVSALGLRLFSSSPSSALTAIYVPDGVDWNTLRATLKGDNGLTVAGGQGDFAGRIFRVAHLGYFDDLDIIAFVAALERALAACGYPFTLGAGLAATQRLLLEA